MAVVISAEEQLFVLCGDQLITLKSLGKICGKRLVSAARICGEDPVLLSLILTRNFVATWNKLNKHNPKMVRRFVNRIIGLLRRFTKHHVDQVMGRVSKETNAETILARLVLYTVDAEHCHQDFDRSSVAWKNFCRSLREVKLRAEREKNLPAIREKAMSFLASIFLAQILGTYLIEPKVAILDFVTTILDVTLQTAT